MTVLDRAPRLVVAPPIPRIPLAPAAAVLGAAGTLVTWLGSWNPSYWGDEAATGALGRTPDRDAARRAPLDRCGSRAVLPDDALLDPGVRRLGAADTRAERSRRGSHGRRDGRARVPPRRPPIPWLGCGLLVAAASYLFSGRRRSSRSPTPSGVSSPSWRRRVARQRARCSSSSGSGERGSPTNCRRRVHERVDRRRASDVQRA